MHHGLSGHHTKAIEEETAIVTKAKAVVSEEATIEATIDMTIQLEEKLLLL